MFKTQKMMLHTLLLAAGLLCISGFVRAMEGGEETENIFETTEQQKEKEIVSLKINPEEEKPEEQKIKKDGWALIVRDALTKYKQDITNDTAIDTINNKIIEMKEKIEKAKQIIQSGEKKKEEQESQEEEKIVIEKEKTAKPTFLQTLWAKLTVWDLTKKLASLETSKEYLENTVKLDPGTYLCKIDGHIANITNTLLYKALSTVYQANEGADGTEITKEAKKEFIIEEEEEETKNVEQKEQTQVQETEQNIILEEKTEAKKDRTYTIASQVRTTYAWFDFKKIPYMTQFVITLTEKIDEKAKEQYIHKFTIDLYSRWEKIPEVKKEGEPTEQGSGYSEIKAESDQPKEKIEEKLTYKYVYSIKQITHEKWYELDKSGKKIVAKDIVLPWGVFSRKYIETPVFLGLKKYSYYKPVKPVAQKEEEKQQEIKTTQKYLDDLYLARKSDGSYRAGKWEFFKSYVRYKVTHPFNFQTGFFK